MRKWGNIERFQPIATYIGSVGVIFLTWDEPCYPYFWGLFSLSPKIVMKDRGGTYFSALTYL